MPSLLQDTTKADEVCIVQHRKRPWRILGWKTKTQSFRQSLELTRTSNQNNRETLQTFKKTNLKRTDIALSLLFLFLIRKIKHRLSLPLRQCCSFVSEGPGDKTTWKCKSCDFPACIICGVLPIAPKKSPYRCESCLFPPCSCGKPRPRSTKYRSTNEGKETWSCSECRLHRIRNWWSIVLLGGISPWLPAQHTSIAYCRIILLLTVKLPRTQELWIMHLDLRLRNLSKKRRSASVI